MNNLLRLRKNIDEYDKKLIDILSGRFAIVKKIALYKKREKLKPLDSARWQGILDKVLNLSRKKKISKKFIQSIMNSIHKESLRIEKNIISKNSKYAKK